MLVLTTVPVLAVTSVTALSTYRTVLGAVQAAQTQAVAGAVVRTRLWYQGIVQMLVAAQESLDATDSQACPAVARAVLDGVGGYEALSLGPLEPGADRQGCSVANDPRLDAAALQGVRAALLAQPPFEPGPQARPIDVRFDLVEVAGDLFLAVDVRNPAKGRDALVLVRPTALGSVFDIGQTRPGPLIGLVGPQARVVAAFGVPDGAAERWLPSDPALLDAGGRRDGEARDGASRTFVVQPLAGTRFRIVASFADNAARAAGTQFATALLAPLAALVLLFLVYARTLHVHLGRWLRGIEEAAREHAAARAVRAPVSPDMPEDIRSVALAFNAMLEDQEGRERRLTATLDSNRFLARELHHRVKNSLQVVQSYIGLSKRSYEGEPRRALADAECRVHVLSAAYRGALADGEMHPVPVDMFVRDVTSTISSLLCGPAQHLVTDAESEATLPVDRAIPLGLLIVDVVSRVLHEQDRIAVTVTLTAGSDAFDLAFTADTPVASVDPRRILVGLVAQLEATPVAAPGGLTLGTWRVPLTESPNTPVPPAEAD